MKIIRKDETVIGDYKSVVAAVKQGVDLSEADLRGANLSYANLSKANLSEVDLREADLCYADLSYADLRGADLRGAVLSEADLCYADLSYADLRGANLSYAYLREVRWNSAILANAMGAPWHFGLGQHVAIVHAGKISIGCKTKTIEWWLERYRAVGRAEGYSDAEIAEYGAWLRFVAERLALRGTEKFSG